MIQPRRILFGFALFFKLAICAQSKVNLTNFTSYHPGGQDRGIGQVLNDGSEIRLTGNAWKKILVNRNISATTVVSFEIRVDGGGEIHGILLDTDDRLQGSDNQRAFKVFGTQNWGRRDFEDYTGPGWQAFEIPVGRFYTGFFDYLVLIADKDSNGASQDSSFRNLSIREASNKTILTNRGITFRVRGK